MSKYRAKKVEVDGIIFDSKKEANRYSELKWLEIGGVIENLRLQVPFVLIDKSEHGRAIKYIADFVYTEGDREIVEDVKGFKTDVYKIKKRLLAERYGIEVREI